MLSLIRLALRNVGRNRRRSLLAIVSVAISLTVIVFAQGFIEGFVASFVKNATKNDAGHIRIAAKKFEERCRFFPVSYNIANPDSIITSIERDPDIALITPRVSFGVLLSNGSNNRSAIALAGDPVKEERLLYLQKSILPPGRYLSGRRELIMGSALAKSLHYRMGDTVRVMTSGSDYALHLKKFVIVGLFATGLNVFDDMMFQIGINDARDLLAMGNADQQIIIMLNDYRKADKVAARIRTLIPDTSISVTPWTRIGDTYTTVDLVGKIYNWIYAIIALLGAFIISNIMTMAVLERRKEIGILKSMGFTRREVLIMFLTEGMVLGFAGSLAGTALGAGLSMFFHVHGIDLTVYMSRISIPLDNVIYTSLGVSSLVYSILLGTVLAALVSVPPARQAARMNVVDAIKSV